MAKQARPIMTAKANTCNIFPVENASNGLAGIMFSKVSNKPVKVAASTFVLVATICAP